MFFRFLGGGNRRKRNRSPFPPWRKRNRSPFPPWRKRNISSFPPWGKHNFVSFPPPRKRRPVPFPQWRKHKKKLSCVGGGFFFLKLTTFCFDNAGGVDSSSLDIVLLLLETDNRNGKETLISRLCHGRRPLT